MKKKKFFFLFVSALMLFFLLKTFATGNELKNFPPGKLGIGIALPPAINLKFWTGEKNAVDLKASWEGKDDKSELSFDYLWHKLDLSLSKKPDSPFFYYGLGGEFRTGREKCFGLRMVFGVNYFFKEAPFDIFLELSPTLKLSPGTGIDADVTFGIRYFFS
ncbi:hypothetical protein H5U35_00630 [Candidatus Aerophobetes bacterium]|nr:hypothetical protein [Candidatus Aerophobetes bacterium]